MKKSLILALTTFLILWCAALSAAAKENTAIRAEGENYISASSAATVITDESSSNNALVSVFGIFSRDITHEFTYSVEAPEAGAYTLTVAGTELNSSSTTDYFFKVNDGDLTEAKVSFENLGAISHPSVKNLALNDLGEVYLNKGTNTIKIIVDNDDLVWGNIIFRMDYMEFTRSGFSIQKIECRNGYVGVFEKDTGVSFDIKFTEPTERGEKLSFTVTDFWSQQIRTGDIVPRPDSMSVQFDLYDIPIGWYKLVITDSHGSVTQSSFSVVPNISDRKNYEDSPFAVDYASSYVPGYDLLKDYTKALKLAGINWGRERYDMTTINVGKGEYENYEGIGKSLEIISDGGLKILDMAPPVTPPWSKHAGRQYVEDLFNMYEPAKFMADTFDDCVSAWEWGNEADLRDEAADVFTAVYKAYAIGVADSENPVLKTFGGFALAPDTQIFMDLCLQNGLMEYSDIYNHHNHVTYDNTRYFLPIKTGQLNSHNEAASVYDDENKEIWITEAGMYCPVESDTGLPSYENLMAQARYAVTSTMQSLSAGTSRHFWFVIPSYVEAGRELGTFYPDDTPYPVYTAEAVMTYVLGAGKYCGIISQAAGKEGLYGYLFDSGENDVAVLWSESPEKVQLKTDTPVKITDIMGAERTVSPSGGYVEINTSHYPVYVTFEGRTTVENYYPQQYDTKELEPKTFSKEERIILYQKYPDECRDNPKSGYNVSVGEDHEITLDVYNFNSEPMKGTIQIETSEGLKLQQSSFSVNIDAMGKETLKLQLSADAGAQIDVVKYVKATGLFDGKETSPSIARVVIKDTDPIGTAGLFENANNPDGWQLSNIAEGGTVETQKGSMENSVEFSVDFHDTENKWFYPIADVTEEERAKLKDADGISFWVYYDDNDETAAKINMFVYFTDGRQYYLGESMYKPLKKGWTQIAVRWSDFVLWSSPLGKATEIRPFDSGLINKVSIGINGNISLVPPYTLRDVGWFIKKLDVSDEDKEIVLSGIEENGIYESNELPDLNITLPENVNLENLRILLNAQEWKEISDFHGNGQTVSLKGLERGYYTLCVASESDMGFIFRKTVRFYVK